MPARAAFAPDGGVLAVLGLDRQITFRVGLVTGDALKPLQPERDVLDFGWMPSGELLLAVDGQGSRVTLCVTAPGSQCSSEVELDSRVHPASSGIAIDSGGHYAVVASKDSADPDYDTVTDLWMVDLRTGRARQVTRTAETSELAPVFQDPASIVFTQFEPSLEVGVDSRGRLYSLPVDDPGEEATPVTEDRFVVGTASASLDGSLVVDRYLDSMPFEWALAIADASGPLVTIANTAGYRTPAVTPDGERVAAFEVGTPSQRGDLVILRVTST